MIQIESQTIKPKISNGELKIINTVYCQTNLRTDIYQFDDVFYYLSDILNEVLRGEKYKEFTIIDKSLGFYDFLFINYKHLPQDIFSDIPDIYVDYCN